MLILLFVASKLLEISSIIHRAPRAVSLIIPVTVSLKITHAVKFFKNFFPRLACVSADLPENFQKFIL